MYKFRDREILFVHKSFQFNKKYLNAPVAFSHNEMKRSRLAYQLAHEKQNKSKYLAFFCVNMKFSEISQIPIFH